MKIATLTVVLLLAIFLAIAGNLTANANPMIYQYTADGGIVAPNSGTSPPIVLIHAQQDAKYSTSKISLPIEAAIVLPISHNEYLEEIYYECDWQTNRTYLYKYAPFIYNSSNTNIKYVKGEPYFSQYSTILNLTVPNGNHTLKVFAMETGTYTHLNYTRGIESLTTYYTFKINASATLNFTVDTVPPSLSVLSVENRTYYSSELPLSFAVDDTNSKITYSLEGQGNVSITGNTTLTLAEGTHNLIVYATDSFGNVASRSYTFNIANPFPTLILAIAVIAVLISISLFVYHRKNR